MDPRDQVPEADALEQAMPAGPQPEPHDVAQSGIRLGLVPEADALEQALPADNETLEDDE